MDFMEEFLSTLRLVILHSFLCLVPFCRPRKPPKKPCKATFCGAPNCTRLSRSNESQKRTDIKLLYSVPKKKDCDTVTERHLSPIPQAMRVRVKNQIIQSDFENNCEKIRCKLNHSRFRHDCSFCHKILKSRKRSHQKSNCSSVSANYNPEVSKIKTETYHLINTSTDDNYKSSTSIEVNNIEINNYYSSPTTSEQKIGAINSKTEETQMVYDYETNDNNFGSGSSKEENEFPKSTGFETSKPRDSILNTKEFKTTKDDWLNSLKDGYICWKYPDTDFVYRRDLHEHIFPAENYLKERHAFDNEFNVDAPEDDEAYSNQSMKRERNITNTSVPGRGAVEPPNINQFITRTSILNISSNGLNNLLSILGEKPKITESLDSVCASATCKEYDIRHRHRSNENFNEILAKLKKSRQRGLPIRVPVYRSNDEKKQFVTKLNQLKNRIEHTFNLEPAILKNGYQGLSKGNRNKKFPFEKTRQNILQKIPQETCNQDRCTEDVLITSHKKDDKSKLKFDEDKRRLKYNPMNGFFDWEGTRMEPNKDSHYPSTSHTHPILLDMNSTVTKIERRLELLLQTDQLSLQS